MKLPLPIAAPSCVIPATVADNARFLAGRVEEVGICLFESQGSLNYTVEDMPFDLNQLPLTWHVHLPVDLPWEAGGGAAAALALAVSHQTRFLHPRLAVLHPPCPVASGTADTLLLAFAQMWKTYSSLPLVLENVEHSSLLDLPPEIWEHFGVCLDVGHMLCYGQQELLQRPALLARTELVHWSAPGQGGGDQHLPLTQLSSEELPLAREAARRVPADVRHVLEIFHWNGVEQSYPVLQSFLES